MSLSTKSKQALKGLAHSLKPVILTGQKGITDNLCLETDRALTIHELIKVKITAETKADRLALAEQLCQFCQATFISLVGHIAIIYRENPEIRKFSAYLK